MHFKDFFFAFHTENSHEAMNHSFWYQSNESKDFESKSCESKPAVKLMTNGTAIKY
jgi:hypothetical protein